MVISLKNKEGSLYKFDKSCVDEDKIALGIDEAGRGPLAGPVVAAAIILDKSFVIDGINDSKKLSPAKREKLYDEIIEKAIAWATGISMPDEIDRINILEATFLAMKRAVENISVTWDLILIDGNRKIPYIENDKQIAIVKGDAKSASIAAASIIAKVTRDRIMNEYHYRYPVYRFDLHKGYGTAFHIEMINRYGICEIHRKSFCENILLQTTLNFTGV